jgi:hypothetical protein
LWRDIRDLVRCAETAKFEGNMERDVFLEFARLEYRLTRLNDRFFSILVWDGNEKNELRSLKGTLRRVSRSFLRRPFVLVRETGEIIATGLEMAARA